MKVDGLLRAIQTLPLGKTAGPDGFGNEFYKAFQNKIIPLMLRMVNDLNDVKKKPKKVTNFTL